MESRIHGDMYVRFGGRLAETYHRKVERRCWPSLLKEIGTICGIDKPISTHTARHTFATTVALENNMPLEVVSKTLGHSNTKMTQRYARTTEALIQKNMEKIKDLY